jgi:hypothetical protein
VTSLHALADIARYALAALVLAACGRSVLQVLRIPIDDAVAWLLGPIVAQALWTSLLGTAVWWGVPLRQIAVPLWAGTVLLATPAVIDAYRACVDSRRWIELTPGIVSLVLPVVVLLPYFVYGLSDYPGSPAPDGWAYTALGQYLWEYPRGTHGGLAPLFEWASHLSGARHAASASISVLSLATHEGDAQSATGLFCALTLFAYAAACAALASARSIGTRPMLLFVALATWSGWLWNVFAVNNLDNALALAYLPAFACIGSERKSLSGREWALTGLLASGVIYTYPEFAVVILACAVALLAHRERRAGDRRWAFGILIAIGVAFVLSGSSWPDLLRFVRAQAGGGLADGPRPGEGWFAGLLAAKTMPSAFWALGSEFTLQPLLALRNALAGMLTILAAVGAYRLARERDWGIVAVLTALVSGALFFATGPRYSYGAYKFVLLAWWAVAFALVRGLIMFDGRTVRWPTVLRTAAAAACCAIPAAAAVRGVRAVFVRAEPSMAVVRQVRAVDRIAAGRALAIAVDDEWASQWAVYYLRGAHAQMAIASGYLGAPHVKWLMDEAPAVGRDRVHLVLTGSRSERTGVEHPDWRVEWKNDVFTLWATDGAASIGEKSP